MSTPNTSKVICHYRVTPGNEQAFEDLLRLHWPTLHELELVSDTPAQHFRGEEKSGEPLYIEIFDWLDNKWDEAHTHPRVMAIWEPMDQLTETRGGKPNMEFPHVSPLAL